MEALTSRTHVELRFIKGCLRWQDIVWQFDGPDSCRALLDCTNVVTPVWEYMVDLFHLLAMVHPVIRSADEVANETILTAKTHLMNRQHTCLASLQTSIPEVWAGPKMSRDSIKHNFGALKDFLNWDAGDDTHGTQNHVLRSVEALTPAFSSLVRSLFEDNHYEFFKIVEFAFE